jgi:ABC-type sugar transport system permease subunit
MRRLLPSWAEVIVFAVLAILFAVCVSFFKSGAHDLGFAAMGGPVFLIAACMGLRRSPAWTAAEETEDVE